MTAMYQYHYKSFTINYFVLYWPRRTPPSLRITTRQPTNYAHMNLSMFNTIEPIAAANYRWPQREIGRPTAVPHRRRLCPLVRRCRGRRSGLVARIDRKRIFCHRGAPYTTTYFLSLCLIT